MTAIPLHDFVEDVTAGGASAIDADRALTDADLTAGGLVPIRAYVRTRASKNAARCAQARQRRAEDGIGQINVLAHEDAKEYIRRVAKASCEGRPWPVPPADQADAPPPLTREPAEDHALQVGQAVLALPGWRRRMVGWMIGAVLS